MLKKEKKEFQNQEHGKIIRWANPPTGLRLEEAVAGGWPLTNHAHLYVEGDLLNGANEPKMPVGITYAPLVSNEGTLVNIIATIRDITRFRQAEELKEYLYINNQPRIKNSRGID